MKFGFGLAILSVFTLGSTKKCEKSEKQLIEEHNPYYVMANVKSQSRVSFTYKDRKIKVTGRSDDYTYGSIEKDIVKEEIIKIESFRNVSKNGSQSDNSFKYNYSTPAFLWGTVEHEMTFYDDGFVMVGEKYCYQFNAEKAASLFEVIETTYQADIKKEEDYHRIQEEEEQIKQEINQNLDETTIDYALSIMGEAESLDLSLAHTYPEFGFYSFKDSDKEFINMFKNANYTESSKSYPSTDNSRLYIYYSFSENDEMSLMLEEGTQKVYLERTIKDKYDRSFYKERFYKTDRETTQTIMNRAYELFEASSSEQR